MVDTSPYDAVFWPIFGTGLTVAFVTSTAAAWSRSFVLPLVLLPLGVIAFWATIFLGSDLGYRAWQGIPNPPDEAYSDSAPAGLMILGWIPGGMFCLFIFAVNWMVRLPFFLKSKTQSQSDSVPADDYEKESSLESNNPFR
jgi:hypothetical protein